MYAITINDFIKKKIYLQKWMFQSSDDCCMSWCQDAELYLTLMWLVLVIHGCFFLVIYSVRRTNTRNDESWTLLYVTHDTYEKMCCILKFMKFQTKIKKKPQKTMQWWNQNPVIFLKYWSCFIYFFIFNLIVYDNVIWETF